MNSPMETRLREALVARAELVTHDTLGPAEPVRSPRRFPLRLLTVAVPLTAAAAIAAVLVTGVVTPQPSAHRMSPTNTGGPGHHPALQSPQARPNSTPDDTGPKLSGTAGGAGGGSAWEAAAPDTVGIDLTSYPPLVPGTRDPAVRVLQKLLNELNYQAGPIDGYFGPRTQDAVTRFRLIRRLPPSERIMPHDWAALLSSGPRPELRKGVRSEDVRRLQRALTATLGRKVTIDGYFGPQTEVAVLDYQKLHGLPRTGVVDSVMWAFLAGKSLKDTETAPPAGSPTTPTAPPSVPSPTPTQTKPPTPSPTASPGPW
jgi:peptidoglycan hydrolase-like protein with peptidoglycan-binding domain